MGGGLGAALAARRAVFEAQMMPDVCYVLERTLVDDLGGTEVEEFRWRGRTFPCKLQDLFRRPEDADVATAQMDAGDWTLVYPAGEALSQSDRVQVGTRAYVVRNTYDQSSARMTNKAYVTIITGEAACPPELSH